MRRQSDLERLIPLLRRYARGLAGQTHIADDLVQDAVMSALRSKGMGSGAALLHRLYAIVTDFNRLRMADRDGIDDYVTDRRGAVISLRRAGSIAEPSPARNDPLAALALEEREALLLVAVEGLTYEQAAGVAGISPLALIARLASARSRVSGQRLDADRPPQRAKGVRHLRVVS